MQNAASILEQLDSREIADRLDQLDGERRALMTLLRAAKAKERGQRQTGMSECRADGGDNR